MTKPDYRLRNAVNALPADEVAAAFAADLTCGLKGQEAKQRLIRFGPNILRQQEQISLVRRFLAQFNDPQMYLLLGATVLSGLVSLLRDGRSLPKEALLILAIAVANAVLGFAQEERAEKALAALKDLQPLVADVLREGVARSIPSADVVPGDLVIVREGKLIPADARLIQATQLSVAEAILTGESEAVRKHPGETPPSASIGDRTNMLFAGTSVISGEGVGLVCATGLHTEIGQISSLIDTARDSPTQFEQRLTIISKQLALAIIVVGAITIVAFAVVVKHPTPAILLNILLFGVSLGVAAAPEALGTIVTLALAIGVQRMAKVGAIVRQLSVMDTLGGVDIILCDKTGTLTSNRMSVATVHHDDVAASMLQPGTAFQRNVADPDIALAASMANDARASGDGAGSRFSGDAVDVALWEYATTAGVSRSMLEKRFQPLSKLAFTSGRKMMTICAQDVTAQRTVLFSKGAPEYVLERCTQERRNGKAVPLSPIRRAQILKDVEQLSDQGEKVIGLAMRSIPHVPHSRGSVDEGLLSKEEHDFTFLALLGLIDPPRPGVREAIAASHRANIRTIVVSGDHPHTAHAIASRIGITTNKRVITGGELRQLSDADLSHSLTDCSVFARINPEDKLRIARILQQAGHVLAMTGDGVNDAPALKAADVGIAMGSGTDIAKDTADIVLTDDNFDTIVQAVRQGRILAANIAKAVTYLFTTNLSEVITLFVVAIASAARAFHSIDELVLPLTTPQILWINLITDVAPAIALALAPAARDVMTGAERESPRTMLTLSSFSQIVMGSLWLVAATLSVYFHAVHQGVPVEYQRTVTLTTLIFSQALYAITVQTGRESLLSYIAKFTWLHLAVLVAVGLHLSMLFIPPARSALGLVPLHGKGWIECSVAPLLMLVAGELQKQWFRRDRRIVDRMFAASSIQTAVKEQ